MHLNLKQIEVFRAIMVTGSISGAAKLLFVSQPAISRLLSYTEQRIGLTLFERIKGRLYPTPEAHLLFVEVSQVYQGMQRINKVVDDLISHRTGHLCIACSPNLGLTPIPHAISKLQEKYPDTQIILYTMLPDVLQQAILNQDVELGIACNNSWHPNLHIRQIFKNRILIALPNNHPLVNKKHIDVYDLTDQPFIGYCSDIPLGQLVSSLLAEQNIILYSKVEVQQVHVACALVQAGAGIAMVDEMTASGSIWTDVVFRPIVTTIVMPINVIHNIYTPLSSLAQMFINILESIHLNRVD